MPGKARRIALSPDQRIVMHQQPWSVILAGGSRTMSDPTAWEMGVHGAWTMVSVAAKYLAGVGCKASGRRRLDAGESRETACPNSGNPTGPASVASDLLAAARAKAARDHKMARDAAALGSTRAGPFPFPTSVFKDQTPGEYLSITAHPAFRARHHLFTTLSLPQIPVSWYSM